MSAAALAPVATAQQPALIAKLKSNVKCSDANAVKQLKRNVVNSGAKRTDLMAALDEISIDRKACAEIKDAASAIALDLSNDDPAPAPAPAAEPVDAVPPVEAEIDPVADDDQSVADALAVAERMEQALIEADKRAAAMRFEVGPPPRNLTRNRATQQ